MGRRSRPLESRRPDVDRSITLLRRGEARRGEQMGRRRRVGRLGDREGLIYTRDGEFENYGIMCLLFETPSGFAIFDTCEIYLSSGRAMKSAWANFRNSFRANFIVFLKEFQTFEDKSTAINADTGINQQLAGMIKRWLKPRMKLGVAKPEYKTIIESKLGITCMHNEAVMELMWGIQRLMHELVPDEKVELTKEDRLPMSRGLLMFLSQYGFDVEPEMVNEEIIDNAHTLFYWDAVEHKHTCPLRSFADDLEDISGFNCEHWDALKLATALMVLCFPEEEIIDCHEVLTEDELSKLEGDAPKYKDDLVWGRRVNMYKDVVSAHLIRIEQKEILGSLVKEAKEACEAERAEACEKGKLQEDSKQIPQEHVIFANICRMILPVISASMPSSVRELPLPKVPKRSWDSAFEPTVANKPIFCEGSSLGENVGSMRIARAWTFSGAQPSTSRAIVPYMPVRHAVLLRIWAESQCQKIDNMDVQRSAYGKSSVQHELVQAQGYSGFPATPPKSVVSLPSRPFESNPSSPLVGEVVRRSPRLNQNNDCCQHVQLQDTRRKRKKSSFVGKEQCGAPRRGVLAKHLEPYARSM